MEHEIDRVIDEFASYLRKPHAVQNDSNTLEVPARLLNGVLRYLETYRQLETRPYRDCAELIEPLLDDEGFARAAWWVGRLLHEHVQIQYAETAPIMIMEAAKAAANRIIELQDPTPHV